MGACRQPVVALLKLVMTRAFTTTEDISPDWTEGTKLLNELTSSPPGPRLQALYQLPLWLYVSVSGLGVWPFLLVILDAGARLASLKKKVGKTHGLVGLFKKTLPVTGACSIRKPRYCNRKLQSVSYLAISDRVWVGLTKEAHRVRFFWTRALESNRALRSNGIGLSRGLGLLGPNPVGLSGGLGLLG
jgi:hypothetical protein